MTIAACSCLAILLFAGSTEAATKKVRKKKPAEPKPKHAVAVDLEYQNFGGSFSPWTRESVEYLHRLDFGPLIGRLNHGRRFNQSGTQFEVDAYPQLGRGMYLYANAGYSAQSIFPRTRVGAELYKSFPNALEGSLGFRQLNFRSSHVTLYTGSAGKYMGNDYYVVRPYVSRREGATAFSGQVMMRRYFATADDHASITATAGKAPTENIAPDAVNLLNSWSVRAEAQKAIFPKFLVKARVGYTSEQIRASTYRRGWLIGAGVQRRF